MLTRASLTVSIYMHIVEMESKNNHNEKKHNENKRPIGLLVVCLTLIMVSVVTVFSLFGWLFRSEAQSFLWPLAISFLIVSLTIWIIPTALNTLPEKRRKLIIIYRIIFSLIGGILFIIDAFCFIENKIYSLMLVVIVICFFVGLILFKKLFKDYYKNNK